MKNKILKTSIPLLVLLITISSCNHNKSGASARNNGLPELMERKDTVQKSGEWTTIKELYSKYSKALVKNPDDNLSRLKLAEVYMNEARISGQQSYYYEAAMQMLNYVIDKKPENKDHLYMALSYKASVLLSLHQFEEAKKVADEALKINSLESGIYGALVDANVELGNYEEAVKYCDKMLSIRPDLRSYSRASYLRQIYGDNAGAIDAMQMAVTAGPSGVESTEWARVILGDLYLNAGKPDSAQLEYGLANYYRPNYPYALMGLAKVERAKKNYAAAMDTIKSAIRIISEAPFVSFLGDLYELKGDGGKAKEVRDDVVTLLMENEKKQSEVPYAKHNAKRELAMAYMNDGKLDEALNYAQMDLQMRPESVDANELVAWIYYLKGNYKDAKTHADKMLKTNTKNSTSLYKAGLIYTAAGDTDKGNKLKADAISINPYIDALVIDAHKPV